MVELSSNRDLALNLDMHRIGKAVSDIGERLEPLEPTIDVTDPEQWVNYAKQNFDQIYKEAVEGFSKMMSLGLHLRIIGRPGRIWALEEFFRHVRNHQDVWVTTRHFIAQHLAKVDPA
jgi:peptidoglycan/xylan/chitin deacetylase (PgdA/CDA1 family)